MRASERDDIGNLPIQLTSFVGRKTEVTDVKRLLTTARLVTLTGIGGIGKTRLALRVAADLRRASADGTWFQDLGELRGAESSDAGEFQDIDTLAQLVRITLGLPDQATASPSRLLAEEIGDRQMLVVLDNCECLLPAVAVLTANLLSACSGLRVIATSREPLRIAGEATFQVPPLPTPDPASEPRLAELPLYESVALFVARAALITTPAFTLTPGNRDTVARICHRLDGLPLAIELAAARLRVLSPQEILDRLDARFHLLSRGSRAVPRRQQTLRDCVEWSFELCSTAEQALWTRLSVFAGGCDLNGIEGVCGDDTLPREDLFDLVAALVDKSILIASAEETGGSRWYRILETIRAFGQEKLADAGDLPAWRRRHRDWYAQMVARADADMISDRQPHWLAWLRREHGNLRAAVEFCLTEPGQAQDALRIAAGVPRLYWLSRGLFSEGRSWLDRALAQPAEENAQRALALLIDSHLAFTQGDIAAGTRLLDQGERLARHLGAPAELAYATFIRGLHATFRNDLAAAIDLLERARKELDQAAQQDPDLRLRVLLVLGVALGMAGHNEPAIEYLEQMLALTESAGEIFFRSRTMLARGLIAWLQGDLQRARKLHVGSLRLVRESHLDDQYGDALCLEQLAWIVSSEGRHEPAATLLGISGALWADLGMPIAAHRHVFEHHDRCERATRTTLGDLAYARAVQAGQAMAYDEALAYALDEPPPRTTSSPSRAATRLTPREEQVADLIRRGSTNAQIATTLVISTRTAESHVDHILTKLGFTSRAQVAAWAAANLHASE